MPNADDRRDALQIAEKLADIILYITLTCPQDSDFFVKNVCRMDVIRRDMIEHARPDKFDTDKGIIIRNAIRAAIEHIKDEEVPIPPQVEILRELQRALDAAKDL